MDPTSLVDNATFRHWTDITDAHAREFQRLQSGDNSGIGELRRLSGELQRINKKLGQGATVDGGAPPDSEAPVPAP